VILGLFPIERDGPLVGRQRLVIFGLVEERIGFLKGLVRVRSRILTVCRRLVAVACGVIAVWRRAAGYRRSIFETWT
jgi:hypothetical protein